VLAKEIMATKKLPQQKPNKKPINPAWIRFMAPVTAQTTDSLFKSIDQVIQQGHDHINLMISSPGGSVFHGLSAHNYLRGIGVPVTTYNFGSVDSIGVIVFCAGEERVCVPHARFLIHGVSLNFQGNIMLDEKGLDEHLKSVKIDAYNIARVIADTTGKKLEEVEKSMLDRTTLNPNQAKDYGLVTKVQKDLYKGGQIHAIYEQGQIFQSSPGMQQLNHVTGLGPVCYSSPSVYGGTTIPQNLDQKILPWL
jgi:ATP-dependent Clp protease, protease subunit